MSALTDKLAAPEVRAQPPVTERKRILLVDDDASLLDGLRDALRPHRHRWIMSFAESGAAGLASFEQQPPDVVISDLKMPGMDGATLLERVRELSPTTIRIVLSGHAEPVMLARASNIAHQILSKPCEIALLVATIDRACQLADTIARVELRRAAVGTSVLPSTPELYSELAEALAVDDASVQHIARIIEQDMGITAKVLQLANSAYYGRQQPVGEIGEAVSYLGLDTVQALVLQTEAFTRLGVECPLAQCGVARVQRHSWRVATLAKQLVPDRSLQGPAFTGGLLHDIGLLVLATDEPETLAELLAAVRDGHRLLFEAERELYGVTHAAVGAHLLALWGLPIEITSAIAAQESGFGDGLELDAAGAIHLANALIEEIEARTLPEVLSDGSVELAQLERRGLSAELPRWRRLAERLDN